MLDINHITNRIVEDTDLTEAHKYAERLQAGAEHWPDKSIWKPEREMVTAIASKLTVDELSYLIAFIRASDELNSHLNYIEWKTTAGRKKGMMNCLSDTHS